MSNTLKKERSLLTDKQDRIDGAIDFIEKAQEVQRAIVQSPVLSVNVNTSRCEGSFVEVTIEAYYSDHTSIPEEAYDFPGNSSMKISQQGGKYRLYLNERYSY